jgi:hypothetical protein
MRKPSDPGSNNKAQSRQCPLSKAMGPPDVNYFRSWHNQDPIENTGIRQYIMSHETDRKGILKHGTISELGNDRIIVGHNIHGRLVLIRYHWGNTFGSRFNGCD